MGRTRRVVIAGAGPAGSAAAMALGRHADIECILLERARLPRTKVCGSGLSPWTLKILDRIGVGPIIRQHAYRIDGALIAGVDGGGVELRGEHETAILLRAVFDQLLAEEAVRRGADLRDGVKVDGLAYDGDQLLGVHTSAGTIEADAVIDASGARGKLQDAKRVGRTLHTILGWYTGVEGVSDIVELYFDATVKPHYGWIFPESESRVNIGICFDPNRGSGNARQRFEAFLDRRLSHRLRHAEQIGKWVGHPVHASAVPQKLERPGVLVAGEAGWLVDSATAEGIYHALASGTIAGEHLARRFAEGTWPERQSGAPRLKGRLGGYTARVRRALMARQVGGHLLMETLRTPALDVVLQFQRSPAVRKLLSKSFAGLYHG